MRTNRSLSLALAFAVLAFASLAGFSFGITFLSVSHLFLFPGLVDDRW